MTHDPVDSAELTHDRATSWKPGEEAEYEKCREAALDDLVTRLFEGKQYPENGRLAIDLQDVLAEVVDAISALIIQLQRVDESALLFYEVKNIIVRNHLEDSTWHEQRAEELWAERETE